MMINLNSEEQNMEQANNELSLVEKYLAIKKEYENTLSQLASISCNEGGL